MSPVVEISRLRELAEDDANHNPRADGRLVDTEGFDDWHADSGDCGREEETR